MAGLSKKRIFYLTVKDIALLAMFTAILFIQEEALTFLPNIQLTVFLLVLYSKRLGFIRTSIIIFIHVILDNLVMGSFSIIWTPAMYVGWMLIPIVLCTIFRKIENFIILAIMGAVFSFTYCWCFVVPNYYVLHIKPLVYLASDFTFECILAASSFISILFLYVPCRDLFIKFEIGKIKEDEYDKIDLDYTESIKDSWIETVKDKENNDKNID